MNPIATCAPRITAALCVFCVAMAPMTLACDPPSCVHHATADVPAALKKLEGEWVEWSVMGSPDDQSRIQAAYFLGVLYGRLGVEVPSWWAEILVRRAIGAENVVNLMEIDERKYILTGDFRHSRTAKISVADGRITIHDARATFAVALDDVGNVRFASEGVLPFVLQYAIDVKRKRAIVLVYHPMLPPPSGWIKCVDIERSTELWSSTSVGDFQLGEKHRRLELYSGPFTSGNQLIVEPCGCAFVFGAAHKGLYVQWYDHNGKTALGRFRYENERVISAATESPADDPKQGGPQKRIGRGQQKGSARPAEKTQLHDGTEGKGGKEPESTAALEWDKYDAADVVLDVGGYVGAPLNSVTFSLTKDAVETLIKPHMRKATRDRHPARYEVDGLLRLYNTQNKNDSITFILYADFTRVSIGGKYFAVDLSSLRRLVASESAVIVKRYKR